MDIQLVVDSGAVKGKTFHLEREETIVGRGSGCDLRIPSAKVSRRHCRLFLQDEFLMAEDLGSANGTLLNGDGLTGVQIVRPGDRLEIGPVTFLVKYRLSPAAIDRLLLMDQEAAEVPEVNVEEVAGHAEADIDVEEVEAGEVEEVEAGEVEEMGEVELEEVGEVEEVGTIEEEAPLRGKGKAPNKTSQKPPTSAKKASAKKKPPPSKKKDKEEEAVPEPVDIDMDDASSWEISAEGDIRDILSQMDDAGDK